MLKPMFFAPTRPKTALALLLVILSASTGVVLYRAYRGSQENAVAVSADKLKAQIAQTLRKNQEDLKFIENKGQWPADVLYALESATGAVWIRKDDIRFRAVNRKSADAVAADATTEPAQPQYEAHTWTMKLVGMNPDFTVRTGANQETLYSYFTDKNNPLPAVRSFKEVTLEGVYPGVDLRFYSGEKEQIEYDFIVAPGADFTRIKMDYEGQDSLKVAEDKSLELGLRFATIKTQLPEVYQVKDGGKIPVEVAFKVEGNRAEFEAKSPIDPTLALVIDPTILWGTYFDNNTSTFDSYAYASKANVCGEVYVGGWMDEGLSGGIYSSTGYDTSFAADYNAVLYRFNAAGTTLLNLTFFGGGITSGEIQHATTFIDLDIFPDGRVIAVGRTQGDIPVTASAYQFAKGGTASNVTGMIAVFNSTLTTLHYASYLGGGSLADDKENNAVRSVVVLDNNTYFVGGVATGTITPVSGSFATGPDTSTTGLEGYVARFSGALYNVRDWATFVGGDGADDILSLALSPNQSKIVFSGWTRPSTVTTQQNETTLEDDEVDLTVDSTAGFPASGLLLIDSELISYASIAGNVFQGLIRGLHGTEAVEHSNNTPVQLQATSNSNFPALVNPVDSVVSGAEAFVGHLNAASPGGFSLLSYIGGTHEDNRPVVTADNDNVFLTGTTFSADVPGAVNSRVATAGGLQVETQTVTGGNGDGSTMVVTVTGAGLVPNPVVVNVLMPGTPNNNAGAANIRAALALNANITALYTVGGSGATYTLTRITAAPNDPTLNMAHADTPGNDGFNDALTSANIAAGLTYTSSDIFVTKIPFGGGLGMAVTRYLGGDDEDRAGGILLTAQGEVLVFGSSENGDTDYPTVNTTPGTSFYDATHNGARDIVWTYLPYGLGVPTFSTFIGGINDDYLGDTGILAGGGHLGFNSATGVITLATTSHSPLPATIITAGAFDTTNQSPSPSKDNHIVLKFSAEVNDFGDAPLSYDGALATAARHGADNSNPRFGSIVDVDPTAQSSVLADADDLNATTNPCVPGGDDEDGNNTGTGSFPVLTCSTGFPLASYSVTINSFNNTGVTANIYAWLDLDGDGIFEDSAGAGGEFRTTTLATGVAQTGVVLTWTNLPPPPANTNAGQNGLRGYYARFRITTQALTDAGGGGLDDRSRGAAINGEVEDYFIPYQNFDYGDAPTTYGTTGLPTGARHLIRTGLFIGATSPGTDLECDGQPNAAATGDNTNGVNDEQAFTSLSIGSTAPSVTIAIPVTNLTGTAAKLCGWIDFNRNGVFDNGGSPNDEGVCVTVPNGTNNTTVNLTWSPLSALPTTGNPVYLRLRLSTDASLTDSTPTGALAGVGDGEVEDHLVTISDVTAVALTAFNAYQLGDSVFVDWKTGFEADNLGFNLYRESGGRRYAVTPSLVAGSALMVGQGTRLEAGLSYAWRDDGAGDSSGVQYWLEEVDLNGSTTTHGPFSVTSGESLSLAKRRYLASQPRALRLNELADRLSPLGGSQAAEPHAKLEFSTEKAQPVTAKASHAAAAGSRSPVRSRGADLSGLHAVKIEVTRAGWYRVPQDVLVAAGLAGDPRNFQLYADGKQVPIRVTGEEDGKFDTGDAVEFYGVGLDILSTDARVYWLMASRLRGQRMPSSGAGGGGSPPPSFTHTVERKDRVVYVSAILNGEAGNFFGIPLAGSNPTVTQALSTPNLHTDGNGAATLDVAIQGVSDHQHSIKVTLNGVVLGSVDFAGQQRGVKSFQVAQAQLVAGDNLVKLDRESANPDVTLVDSLRLTYQHSWKADSNALLVSAQGGQQVTIGGFTGGNVRIIDITDTDSPVELTAEVTGGQGSFTVSAAVASPGARKLYAFSSDVVKTAANVKVNEPSTWKRAENRADFLIISHSSLKAGVAPLVELRRSQGWSVVLVDVDDIYDEFSYGHKTPEAISDFIRFAATSWKLKPTAVLFVGKATYDPRSYLGQGDPDLVPTNMIDTQMMESAVDDSLADFNNDGVPELAVGRLPVRNAAETLALVAKIIAYEVSVPSNRVALISDIGDTYPFGGVSAQLKGVLPAGTDVQEISRGQMGDSQARARILEEVNRAHRIINYVGHGSIQLWRGGLLTTDDAASLQKGNELSLYIMMTCLNGYFISPSTESLSESLLRSPGGAVAAWASSGTTTPEGQAAMNVAAFQHLFGGQNMTLGEAARAAKAAVGEADIRRTWNLLGDPTMRLR